jgi:hypothetical protein
MQCLDNGFCCRKIIGYLQRTQQAVVLACWSHYLGSPTIIAKVSILYGNLGPCSQRNVLREMVDKIVVDRAGTIVRMDLLSPFAYLKRLTDRVRREVNSEGTERNENSGTEAAVPNCSDCTASGGPKETRTLDLFNAIEALSQLSYRPDA